MCKTFDEEEIIGIERTASVRTSNSNRINMIRCVTATGSRGVMSHRNIAAVAVAVTMGVFGIGVQAPYRTYAMATTTTHLSDSIQQSLPQLYETPLKRILDYTTDPITKSVTANIDTDDTLTLRRVVDLENTAEASHRRPTVGFVIRRPG